MYDVPCTRLLGVEPDYLLHSKVSPHWTPVWNGAATPPVKYSLQGGGPGGKAATFRETPPGGGLQEQHP